MKQFENITPGTKVLVTHEGFKPEVGTVVKVFKKHFRVAVSCSYYSYNYDGFCIDNTFFKQEQLKLA